MIDCEPRWSWRGPGSKWPLNSAKCARLGLSLVPFPSVWLVPNIKYLVLSCEAVGAAQREKKRWKRKKKTPALRVISGLLKESEISSQCRVQACWSKPFGASTLDFCLLLDSCHVEWCDCLWSYMFYDVLNFLSLRASDSKPATATQKGGLRRNAFGIMWIFCTKGIMWIFFFHWALFLKAEDYPVAGNLRNQTFFASVSQPVGRDPVGNQMAFHRGLLRYLHYDS